MSGADLEYAAQLRRAGQTSAVGKDGAYLEQLGDQREALLGYLLTGIIISLDTDGVPYVGAVESDLDSAIPVAVDTDGVFYFVMGP